MSSSFVDIVRKAVTLARPFGSTRLAAVTALCFAQGFFQVLGVTSVFPFLALAADPERLRNSAFGRRFLELLPEMSDLRLLLVSGIFAVVMLVLSSGVNVFVEFARARYAHEFGHWLRTRLLRKMASRPYGDFLQQNTGVLVKKVVGDVMGYVTGVLLPLLDSLARLVTIALLTTALFFVHPKIAVAASCGLGLFYVAIYRSLARWRRTTAEKLKLAGRGTYIETQQLLGGIKPVKVHRCEEEFINRFAVHSHRQARLMPWVPILSGIPRYLIEPVLFGGLIAVVVIYAVQGHDFSVILPNLGVMALTLYRMLPAVQLLYGQLSKLSTMRHTLDEVYEEFLAVENSTGRDDEHPDGSLTRPEPLRWHRAINLENITFQYPEAAQPTLDGFSLTIPRNGSLGISGSTGCGKSTLVDLILGLHQPTSGRILVDDTPLGPGNRRAWRGGIGYVPQEIFLIDDSLAANIAFGVPKERIDRAALVRAARAAQILEFIEKELPLGFETVVGERGVRLSGGQRQRVGLARALYHEPELLVLDEATSALDHATEQEVMRAIQALKGSLTMIIIAHRLSTIEMCEQRLNMNELEAAHADSI